MRELFNRVFKKEEGFSLIELIIVIAILAIIAAIAVPTLLGNIQKANESSDISNAKLIADAVATAIATNPALEGTIIAAGTAVADGSAAGTVLGDAQAKLNGKFPVLKSKKYAGTVGDNFTIQLTAAGVITIKGTNAAAAPLPANATLFPQ